MCSKLDCCIFRKPPFKDGGKGRIYQALNGFSFLIVKAADYQFLCFHSVPPFILLQSMQSVESICLAAWQKAMSQ